MVTAAHARPQHDPVPPLETGDRLSREEFEARWALHPEIKKAELIDGMVFVQLAVNRTHSKPHGAVAVWLGTFAARQTDTEFLPESTVRLGNDDVQPDGLLRRTSGTSVVGDDDCIHGPPELIVEVSASSVSYDLNLKKEVYRRNGVREYLAWQVFENRIDWWELVDGQYVLLEEAEAGTIESRVFPGLRLDREAMLLGDIAAVLAAL